MKNQHKKKIYISSDLYYKKINKDYSLISKNNSYYNGFFAPNKYIKKLHIDLTTQINSINDISNLIRYGKLDSISKMFYLKSFSWIIKVIKFTGKGYRLRKFSKSKVLEMNFNNSHVTRSIGGSSIFKRISKTEIGLIDTNKVRIIKNIKNILSVRVLNVFTKRGLRCNKQFILKRPGKKNNI